MEAKCLLPEDEIRGEVSHEVSRILTVIGMDECHIEPIIDKTVIIHSALRPGLKYRNIEMLVPVVIYFYCRFEHIDLDEKKLLLNSMIAKDDYICFIGQIVSFLPVYNERKLEQSIVETNIEIIK